MSQSLSPEQLTLNIDPKQFKFADTSSLLGGKQCSAQQQAWVAQPEAKKAAEFGLAIRQPGFNLLALGEILLFADKKRRHIKIDYLGPVVIICVAILSTATVMILARKWCL